MPMGGVELLVILVIILLFVGAKRIPQLAKSLGVGARELKRAASEDADEGEANEEASAKDAAEAKTKVAPEDATPARDEDRAEPKAPDR